jgi:hypothetical protein
MFCVEGMGYDLQHSPSIVTNGLVFYIDAINTKSYPGSGSICNDLSNNNNSVTLTGSPTVANNSFTFNGSTQYGTVSNNIINPTAYTKCVFFYPTVTNQNNNILSNNSGTILWMNGGNRLVTAHTTTSYGLLSSNTLISANTWYHGAVTFDSVNGHKMYINGVLDVTSADITLPTT